MGKLLVRLAASFALALALALPARADDWQPPSPDSLPDDAWGRAVRLGRDLIVRTPSLIGPEAADPAHRFAGNNLSCQSCHLQAGTARYGLSLVGVFADFPQYRPREGGVRTIEDRIEGCLTRSMNGRELPQDSPEMRALGAYLKFLSTCIAVGAATPGRCVPELPPLDRAADPAQGAAVYARACAACHGADGAGKRLGVAGDARGYAFPPLWGADSFNIGAGMARLTAAAGFIHANMPYGTTWQRPALSEADAWDVAAFVASQDRPAMDGLERDYPNKLQKPADAPFGPWPDTFSAEQHKYGPFGPIRDALRALRAAAAKPSTGGTP